MQAEISSWRWQLPGQSYLSQLGRVLRIQLFDKAWFRAHVPVIGLSISPFADSLCQNITKNSVFSMDMKGSDIDAQGDASCTRNAARLQHLHASDPALSVPRAPVDTKWLRTGLGTPTPQCRLPTAAYERFFSGSLSALADSHPCEEWHLACRA